MESISRTHLPNGLEIVSILDPHSPTTTLAAVFRAGALYEQPDQLGYAHILEHMLLRGTTKRPTSYEIGLVIDRIGAYSNAHTSLNTAVFELQAANEYIETLFDVMADNLQNALIDKVILENEKKVIHEELRRTQENKDRIIFRAGTESIVGNHPLGRDPIGNEASIANAKREDIVAYWKSHYTPRNAALFVIGNTPHDTAMTFAQKYFGDWNPQAQELPSIPNLQPETTHTIKKPGQANIPYLFFGFPLTNPYSEHDDIILNLISTTLTYGYTSILRHELRSKRGLVYVVRPAALKSQHGGVFCLTMSSQKPTEVIETVTSVITNLGTTLSDSFVDELKKQQTSIYTRTSGDQMGQLKQAIQSWTLGQAIHTTEEYVKKTSAITPEEVRAFVQRYLQPNQMTIVELTAKE